MGKFEKIIGLSLLIFSSGAFASLKYNSLTLTLLNNTNQTFSLEKIASGPNNTVDMQPRVILPHQAATFTGLTSKPKDLSAELYLLDEKGNENVFLILDPRRIHIIQPIFSLSYTNPLYKATINSLEYYSNAEPQDLVVKSAQVSLNPVE
jgi:hypothetical protein